MDIILTNYPPATGNLLPPLSEEDKNSLKDVLASVSNDFVPPLGARNSTTQAGFTLKQSAAENVDIDTYFDAIMEQYTLLAKTPDGEIAGFISYRVNYKHPLFTEEKCFYVSTIAVLPKFRRQGIADLLYAELFKKVEEAKSWVLLRTWSTNLGHIMLLNKLGFHVEKRLVADRSLNIDTMFFGWHTPEDNNIILMEEI